MGFCYGHQPEGSKSLFCTIFSQLTDTGVMHSMSSELKYLKERGSIVNAASICGLVGLKGAGAYCASKHGVIGLTRAAAKEVGEQQFRINCVAP
jgi:NAD(P)-dependent dehydrogenase (short-subunit alcohol dehydrogenase family)